MNNLCEFILNRLDSMQEHDLLTWRNSTLPSDEILIKIGGDHSGDTFKISVQVLNTTTPNAKDNTIVVECFQAKDSAISSPDMREYKAKSSSCKMHHGTERKSG